MFAHGMGALCGVLRAEALGKPKDVSVSFGNGESHKRVTLCDAAFDKEMDSAWKKPAAAVAGAAPGPMAGIARRSSLRAGGESSDRAGISGPASGEDAFRW